MLHSEIVGSEKVHRNVDACETKLFRALDGLMTKFAREMAKSIDSVERVSDQELRTQIAGGLQAEFEAVEAQFRLEWPAQVFEAALERVKATLSKLN